MPEGGDETVNEEPVAKRGEEDDGSGVLGILLVVALGLWAMLKGNGRR